MQSDTSAWVPKGMVNPAVPHVAPVAGRKATRYRPPVSGHSRRKRRHFKGARRLLTKAWRGLS